MFAYCASGDVTGGVGVTIIAIAGAEGSRPKLVQVIIGCPAAPADNAALFAIRKFAVDGTPAAPGTVLEADPGGPVARCTTGVDYTGAEPEYVAGNLVEIPLNQRNTAIWTAPLGGEIITALGATNGIGVQMVDGPEVPYNVSLVWEE